MNRIFTYGLAAVTTTILGQPVYAKDGGKSWGGGGGGARASAPAFHAAPAMHANAGRSFSGPSHFSGQAPKQFQPSFAQSRPRTTFTPSVAQTRSFRSPATTFTPSVASSRSFAQPQRNAPSIAFGGRAFNNGNSNAVINAQNARNFGAASPGGRWSGNTLASRAPANVSRDWDHRHMHSWNHHHYRWYGGDWVIADGGFYGGYPYDSEYGYGYGMDDGYYGDNGQPPVTYSAPGYSYDSSESVAQSVQDQLARLGYSPGPVDGVIGPQTRDAIMDFQNDHRLPVTGQIDGTLLRALGL